MTSNISNKGDENHDDDNDDSNNQAQEHDHEEIKDGEFSVRTPQSSQSSSNHRVILHHLYYQKSASNPW